MDATTTAATVRRESAAGTSVLRAYRGPQDHPAMVRVSGAVRAFNGERASATVAGMDSHYSQFDAARLLRDCALVEVDGRVVAYGRVSWEPQASGAAAVNGILNIHPAHRGRGIEELLLGHAIRRADELSTELGEGRPVTLGISVTDRDPHQRAAAAALGFVAARSFAQLIRPDLDDVPQIPLPEGFEIRRIAADDRAMHRRVFDADARAFADTWGQEAPSEARFESFIGSPTFDPTLWRVAFHGDDIAGQILNFMDEAIETDGGRIGWTEAISVQPEFRRRGLARALLAASLRAVRDAGASRAGLGVDLENPNHARSLYESLGYRIVSTDHWYELAPFPRARR
ncbi:MAG TPA: GNAT family N-acetyltransferase [Candidatus Limnocylindrales bacterium]|nr:GNAT family N-acetyltransferase [Candidatus Limnocylindrales bacterium]